MENITEVSSGSWSDELNIDCNDLTNNGIYILFVGYVLPLLSPKVRNYGRELWSSIKNAGKITSECVSVTEYGFEKIQDLSNNGEMRDFISRVCDKKGINIFPKEITEIAWSFSGDTNNGNKENLQQTWKKLIDDLDRINSINKMDNVKP